MLTKVVAAKLGLWLLDEPATFLDVSHQVEMLDLLTDLNRTDSQTIVLMLHDLNLACRYADHVIAMRDGAIVAEGPAAVTEHIGDDGVRRLTNHSQERRFLAVVRTLVSRYGVDEQRRSGPTRAPLGKFVAATDQPPNAFAVASGLFGDGDP